MTNAGLHIPGYTWERQRTGLASGEQALVLDKGNALFSHCTKIREPPSAK